MLSEGMLFMHVYYAFSLLLQADEPEHKKYKSRDGSVKKVSAVIFNYVYSRHIRPAAC